MRLSPAAPTTTLTFDGLVATIGRVHAVLAQQATKAINTARRQLYGYLEFYRTYPQLVRTAHAQGTHLFPLALPGQKVRTVSALSGATPEIDPEKLISELSHSHFQLLVELQGPLKRRFYEVKALRGNWSVRELKRQIDTQYFECSALLVNKNLASQQVHAAAEQQATQLVICDPYVFEFLPLKPSEVVSEGQLVKYALADMANNIFVSHYQTELPGKEAIAAFLQRAMQALDGDASGEPSA